MIAYRCVKGACIPMNSIFACLDSNRTAVLNIQIYGCKLCNNSTCVVLIVMVCRVTVYLHSTYYGGVEKLLGSQYLK